MLFAIVGVACLGLAIGLKLQAPALIAATLVVIVACIATSIFLQLSVQTTIRSTFYLIIVNQIAYLVGIALVLLSHRARGG